MTKTRIEIKGTWASGGRKGWSKLVTACDESKANGYALAGDFLNEGIHEVEPGAVVVQKIPCGSVKNGYDEGWVGTVGADGTIDWQLGTDNWRKNFLALRDKVTAALEAAKGITPKAAAISEIRRLMAEHAITAEELS